jgi:hypothetical protein
MPTRMGIALLLLPLILSACHHGDKTSAHSTASPRHVQSAAPFVSDAPPSYDLLVRRGMEELSIKMEMQENAFQISRAAWNVDQDNGVIRFEGPNGIIATAPVQIIGIYNTAEGTWQWAWDNPSVHPALAEHASAWRDYGQQNSLPELTTSKLTCDQEHCWTFVAADATMTNAQGAYRGIAGDTAVFMTFGEVQLSKAR